MMTYKFYDTCSLLLKANNLFDEENVKIVISSITIIAMVLAITGVLN